MLGKILDAAGPNASVISWLAQDPTSLQKPLTGICLGTAYRAKVVKYQVIDPRLFKRCLQGTAASVFGGLDPFSMTEFVVKHLKDPETQDWMASRSALRRTIITNELSTPGRVDFVTV